MGVTPEESVMEKPASLSPEEKKRKKSDKESEENQSRFERIQAALRRVMESLLDPPKNDDESNPAKESRREVRRSERSSDDVAGNRSASTETVSHPELQTTPASAEQRSYQPPTETSRAELPSEDSRRLNSAYEPRPPTTPSEPRSAVLRERADQIWQQARESVRGFIDRSRAVVASESESADEAATATETQPAENDRVATATSESVAIGQTAIEREPLAGLTIAELEDRLGKQTAGPRVEQTVETSESSSSIVPLYVAFNELRQRRYKKKLKRIADEQRQQQRRLDQTERDSNARQSRREQVTQQTPATPAPILAPRPERQTTTKAENKTQTQPYTLRLERKSQRQAVPEQPEVREGEVRVNYPPVVAPRPEQVQVVAEPAATQEVVVDESEAESQRVARPRSQPAVAIKEVVERHPVARLESLNSSTPETTTTPTGWEQRTDTATNAADQSASGSSQGVASGGQSQATNGSDAPLRTNRNTSNGQPQHLSDRQQSVSPIPRWQQVVLIVVNLLLIALLVRELVS